MKKLASIMIGLSIALSGGSRADANAAGLEAMITLKVVDDNGSPYPNIPVKVGIKKHQSSNCITDSNGMVVASGISRDGHVGYLIQAEGYYYLHGAYNFILTNEAQILSGRWYPWNPTNTVILRKIKNPIPLYAKWARILLPGLSSPFGYDLEVGDWVAPHGNGVINDLIYKLDRRYESFDDFDITASLSFSNPWDGIQELYSDPNNGSQLRLPHYAPTNHYLPRWSKKIWNHPEEYVNIEFDANSCFFFRVRTELDDQSNIIHALYGKIYGDIEFGGYGVGPQFLGFMFRYYLNPVPNDRNLEFDPKRNLFKKLEPREEVWNP